MKTITLIIPHKHKFHFIRLNDPELELKGLCMKMYGCRKLGVWMFY